MQKTKELTVIYTKLSSLAMAGQPVSKDPLAAALDGIFGAPVNGGVSLYRKNFLTSEYFIRNPDRADALQKLRDAMDQLVSGSSKTKRW